MNEQNIKLTEEETAVIYRCRQKELIWATWGKFAVLLIGAFDIFLSLVLILYVSSIKLYRESQQTLQTFQTFSFVVSVVAGVILVMGILKIKLAIRFWNGNPTRTVLLKLIDRLANQEKTAEAPPELSGSK
jgi:hypothetical protein